MKRFRDTKYYVSPNGEILNSKTQKLLKQANDKDGYKKVTFISDEGNKKSFRVHRVVAELYCDNYNENLQVNHKDGNKQNNHWTNLEWVTCKENIIHSWETGLRHKNYSQEELNQKNRESQLKRYSKLNDLEKEIIGNSGKNNPAYGVNYNKNKTKEQLEEIKIKKIKTNLINKDKHMHKRGRKIIINNVAFNSINEASTILGYSFKYIKRRILSNDYEDYCFA